MRPLPAIIAICLSASALAGEVERPAGITREDAAAPHRQSPVPADVPAAPEAVLLDARCCKICSKGQACGDSCISRDRQCGKGPGCACDG